MTLRPTHCQLMTMDASVLIDFINAERTVIELVVKHVGPLCVISPVVDEVNEIEGESELIALGVNIVEPEIEDAYAAAGSAFREHTCNQPLLFRKR